jgi:BCD family chlorophyll transporter-like MFS transporter
MTTTESQVDFSAKSVAEKPQDRLATYRFRHVLRMGSFQIGSAMADILVTSVWNRIMIVNFGIPAWPVGLLIALRYFLFPISLWAGYRSDSHPIRGLHRTPYIWAGRLMMVASFPLLGLSLARLAEDQGDPMGWFLSLSCFLLYGIGILLSGSPFLALVRDSVPKEKQGLAISTVETVLIAFFPVWAITFGYWLGEYQQSTFWQIVLFSMFVAGFFWWFAIAGVEKKSGMPGREETGREKTDFSEVLHKIWRDKRTRRFFVFLAVGTLAAWGQDNVLEPFGGQVLDLDVGQTTRFNAYWQGTLVVVLVITAYLLRKRRPEQHTKLTKIGLAIMALGMVLLTISSLSGQYRLVLMGLVVFGVGFGLYTFGAFSLLAVMTTDVEAGAYLGLWTVCILVSRGLGISLGSILRDVFLGLSGLAGATYAAIFFLEALGLVTAAAILSRKDILSFAGDAGRLDGTELPVSGFDL